MSVGPEVIELEQGFINQFVRMNCTHTHGDLNSRRLSFTEFDHGDVPLATGACLVLFAMQDNLSVVNEADLGRVFAEQDV